MSKPVLVGITGGIGSGKSICSDLFQLLGVPVYNSDNQGKRLMVEDTQLVDSIKAEFGSESYFDDGSLNREYLAAKVFPNKEQLEVLNALVHPAVGRDFENWISQNLGHPYLLKEAALLYETGIYQKLDKNVCVLASKEVRMERVLLRDEQRGKEQVENIMEKQVSDNQRKKLSDFLIQNSGEELLIPQVLKIHQSLLDFSSKRA